MDTFSEAYMRLNRAQQKAVESIEGPVMVVAGPGTGKTQVLALRIAYILQHTDVGADSVLCLTFTRSGVLAMRERLERYIGSDARKVRIETFHSFAHELVLEHYEVLGFDIPPTLLDDTQAVLLVDELLHNGQWEYIRPRTNPAQYFTDLRQLISILKRENISPQDFRNDIDLEIETYRINPDNISTRGTSKGSLKKEIEKKIESLSRTKEVVDFYEQYETLKRTRALMDYDDVLQYVVRLTQEQDDVRADLQETYQYVLVDEHQDSSGVQNAFLRSVWEGVDQPNIFVVGDDRQLIYGFSGASLSYFEEFRHIFGKATLITLSENYRSTPEILALADTLLQSSVSKDPLVPTRAAGEAVTLGQYQYERDELIGAAMYFKAQIEKGVPPEECALLVPKNRHVQNALALLRSYGLPVALQGSLSLFSERDAGAFLRVLRIVADPYDIVALSESLLDETSGVVPLEAHAFLHEQKGKPFIIETMRSWGSDAGLFNSSVAQWGTRLARFIQDVTSSTVADIVAHVGNELLVNRTQSHEALLRSVEIVRSFLHTVLASSGGVTSARLAEYISYMARLQEYHQDIPLAAFEATTGIRVMTLHKSKGLEFDHVWIAHMNEETLMSSKRSAFTLPEPLLARLESRDRAAATRELYVALTRAKASCTISYAALGYDDRPRMLAEIIADIPAQHFVKQTSADTEQALRTHGPEIYTYSSTAPKIAASVSDVCALVATHYTTTKVSVTLLNNFFECPWKWYFRNFLKLPEVKGVSLALGSAVHSTIEYILNSDVLPGEQAISDKIKKELEKEGVSGTADVNRLAKDANRAVQNWIKDYYKHLAKDRISERAVQGKDAAFPHLQLYGKIDLTERFPDGDVVVTDFKTGSIKTSGVIEKITEEGRLSDYMRQLAMYSYLIRLAEKKDVARSRLLFVESDTDDKNALYETHIDDEKIDLLIRDIKEYDAALKSGEWAGRKCQHKGYGTDKECQYCALAQSILGSPRR